MEEKKPWDSQPLIRCENKECDQLCTESELERNDGKCPYCGTPVSTSE